MPFYMTKPTRKEAVKYDGPTLFQWVDQATTMPVVKKWPVTR